MHQGRFSRQILRVANPRTLYLIDPWMSVGDGPQTASHYGSQHADQEKMDQRYETLRKSLAPKIEDGQIVIVRKRSLDAVDMFEDGSIDFVYIDGDHEYAAVKADIDAYLPKVKKGGLLIGDDYMDGYWWGRGVINAFHDALAQYPVEIDFKIGEQIAIRV